MAKAPPGHDLGGPGHQVAPVLGGPARLDGVAPGLGAVGAGSLQVGRLAAPGAGADVGDPAGAVLGPAHDHLGDHQRGAGARRERQGAERHRAGPRHPDLVVGPDGGQRGGGRAGRRRRVARRPVDHQRAPPAGQAGPALLEHDAVVARERHQVDVGVEAPGAGDEGHERLVAVTSWAIPPDSSRRSTPAKPARATMATISSGGGR